MKQFCKHCKKAELTLDTVCVLAQFLCISNADTLESDMSMPYDYV